MSNLNMILTSLAWNLIHFIGLPLIASWLLASATGIAVKTAFWLAFAMTIAVRYILHQALYYEIIGVSEEFEISFLIFANTAIAWLILLLASFFGWIFTSFIVKSFSQFEGLLLFAINFLVGFYFWVQNISLQNPSIDRVLRRELLEDDDWEEDEEEDEVYERAESEK